MLRIALILLAFDGISDAAMQDGGDLKEGVFTNVAYIQNKAAPHETICISTVFNSFTVFTSDVCKLDEADPMKYRLMPATEVIKEGFDVTKAKAFDVVRVETFRTSNFTGIFLTKIIRIAPPGMIIGKEAMTSPFVTDWEDWLAVVKPNHTATGAVMSGAVPPKGGAVIYRHVDDYECNATYNAQHDAGWPERMSFEHFCIFHGKEEFNLTFAPGLMPGMPCEDSLGSPVWAVSPSGAQVVLGVLLVTKCSANPPFGVAVGAPDFLIDTYYTPTPPTPRNLTFPTSIPLTTPLYIPRSDRPWPTWGPKPANKGAIVVVHLPLWCAMLFTAAYSGL